MYKPTPSEVQKIIRQHNIWLQYDENGEKADLSYFDLPRVCLSKINLSDANMYRADIRKANLREAILNNACLAYANLSYADLTESDLSDANMDGASLIGSNMTNANLSGCNLYKTIGNGREIVTIQAGNCHVNITDNQIWINEHHHTWNQWLAFDDADIKNMGLSDDSLAWWHRWNPRLSDIINERRFERESTKGNNEIPIGTPALGSFV